MENDQPDERQFIVPRIDGLNERESLAGGNKDSQTQLDILEGFIHQRSGIIERAPGIKLLQQLSGKRILNICQTFDSRKNVLVQTNSGVYLFSEDEIVNRTTATNLVPVTLTEEESMSKAILVHSVAAGTAGGTYTTANVWQQAPINAILSQLNPDGSAATFVSLAANVFTLAAGNYRFRGFSLMGDTTANIRSTSRLFNVTAGAAAWVGLFNENGTIDVNAAGSRNSKSEIFGDIVGLAVPTQFQIDGKAAGAEVTNGFGFPMNSVGTFDLVREVYRFLEIIKTA